MMKTQTAIPKNSEKASYAKELDKLEDQDLFPKKSALAKATLLKSEIPSHKSVPNVSS